MIGWDLENLSKKIKFRPEGTSPIAFKKGLEGQKSTPTIFMISLSLEESVKPKKVTFFPPKTLGVFGSEELELFVQFAN